MEPVPLVRITRQTKVARPAALEKGFMRRSIMVHR